MDHEGRGCWAVFSLDSGEPCWLSIAQTGVLVKKSKLGILGPKLYDETDIYAAAKTVEALQATFVEDRCPKGMTNPALRAFANAILRCRTAEEVATTLRRASHLAASSQAADALEAISPSIESLSPEEQLDTVVETAVLAAQTSEPIYENARSAIPAIEGLEAFKVHVLFTMLGTSLLSAMMVDLDASSHLCPRLQDRIRVRIGDDRMPLAIFYLETLSRVRQECGGDLEKAAGHLIIMLSLDTEHPMREYDVHAQSLGSWAVSPIVRALSQLPEFRQAK